MSNRRRTELTTITRGQLAELAKSVARGQIVGGFFIGTFHKQEVRWLDDGSIEVITDYTQGSWDDYGRTVDATVDSRE